MSRSKEKGEAAGKLNCFSQRSCTSGRAFRVGFGPKVDKTFGLNSGLRRTVLFALSAQKSNQNNLVALLNFSDVT